MRWSIRLGSVSGIDVYVHVTFALLLIFVAFVQMSAAESAGTGLWAALEGMIFIVLVFGIVVLHELGHATAARRYGIKTRDITLYPIGGLARLERMPTDPWQEFVVAIAGPLVNIFLAAILFVPVYFMGGLIPEDPQMLSLRSMLYVNIALAVFNFLPAFPMDGGRILRAVLGMNMDYVRATSIAATVGQIMAAFFVIAVLTGLWPNPLLLFIALVVWMGAAQEASIVQFRVAVRDVPVQNAMITDFEILAPDDPLQDAVEHIIAGFQADFPVVRDGEVIGILTRKDLLQHLADEGRMSPVGDAMITEFKTAEADEMLERAFERIQEAPSSTMPVLQNGELVGLLTMENIGELMAVKNALKNIGGNLPPVHRS